MKSKKRVLVIGGGVGGTMTVNNLVNKLYPEICRNELEVMMLSNSETHEYKPANMYVAFNSFYPHELRRKQRSLLRPEINFQVEEVIEFNFQGCYVACKSGKKYHYDYLLISTGCIPSPERIEGLKQAGDHFYQTEPAQKLGGKLRNIKEGRILITVNFPETPNVPHQCGIAPVETTLMLHEYLTQRGVRDKVEIMYTYPTVAQTVKNCLFLQKPTCSVLPNLFEV